MKKIQVSPKNCVGCEICAITCSVAHGEQSRESAMRIRVLRQFPEQPDRPFQPLVCQQCEKPQCVEVCSPGALVLDNKKKQVLLLDEKCNGCGACVDDCPFGAIWIDPLRQVAIKCDLCGGDPQCVKYCQFDALASPFIPPG